MQELGIAVTILAGSVGYQPGREVM